MDAMEGFRALRRRIHQMYASGSEND